MSANRLATPALAATYSNMDVRELATEGTAHSHEGQCQHV